MSSIPLPALAIQPPAQPQNPIEQLGRILQLKQLMQNAPLQTQQLQQQVQMGQQDIQARQALNQAYASAVTKDANGTPQFDPDKLQQSLATGPAAYQTPAVLKNIADFQKSRIDLQNSVTELHQKGADMIGSAASAVKAAGYDPTLAHSMLDTLPPSPQLNQIRSAIDGNPQQFHQMIDSAIQNSPEQQKLLNAQTVAGIRANTPEAQMMNSWLQQQNANLQPGQAPKTPADYQAFKVAQGVQADVLKQTNPQVQQSRIQVARAEGQARADIAAQIARGSGAALAQVPPHLVGPATAAATKAGQDYAQADSVSQRIAEMLNDARNGNVVSYQLLPQEGALQLTTSQGVKRINMAEIQNYGGGSLWQNLQGHLGKALTGQSIPPSVLNDMGQIQDLMARGAQVKYNNELKTINQTYGANFQPVQMDTMPKAGGNSTDPFAQFGGKAH